jgi:dephospho-CoA kinase
MRERLGMTQNRAMILGITGNSGGGKTTVGQFLSVLGGFVLDADKHSREALLQGNPAYHEAVKMFGKGILNEDERIDRKKLARIVFSDAEKKKALEGIIHPQVSKEMQELTQSVSEDGHFRFAVWDAPLLIEAGMLKYCDCLFIVRAPFEAKIGRICARDRISREHAMLRLKAQPSEDELFSMAKQQMDASKIFIVDNEDEDLMKLTASRLIGKCLEGFNG